MVNGRYPHDGCVTTKGKLPNPILILRLEFQSPLASLSDKSRSLFDYFFQKFAQVTNPPIDPIREELVMSLKSYLGPKPNTFDFQTNVHQKLIEIEEPIISNQDINKIKMIQNHTKGLFKSYVLDICYTVVKDEFLLEKAIQKICIKAENVILQKGINILILSDRGVDKNHFGIPALLATSAIHHYLIQKGLRTKVGLGQV